jgi:hypothetical protein
LPQQQAPGPTRSVILVDSSSAGRKEIFMLRFKGLWLVLAISCAALAAACGGSGAPMSPSPTGGGATITGVVNGSTVGGGFSMRTAATTGGITVTVTGTSISASVDGQGRFTLTGVPTGTIQLTFTGNGVSATVTITDVQQSEQITMTLTVTGGTATIEAQQRNGSGKVQLEGRITAITTSPQTIQVAGVTVAIGTATVFKQDETLISFGALVVGDKVHVRASGTPLVAEQVTLQETELAPPTQTPVVEMEGRIAAINPVGSTPPTLVVDNTWVSVPVGTEIRHGSTILGFTDLKVGDRVHVRGNMEGTVLVAQLVNLQNDNPVSVVVKGAVTVPPAITGTCPAIIFTVQGWTVQTSLDTDFAKGPCTAIAAGTNVQVKGIPQGSTGVLAATWIQIDK